MRNKSGQATSFGVISLLGDEQALLIETLLRQRLSPDEFARHRLLCGNAAQFQGDERDVMFLSMVDSPPENGQLTIRDSGPQDVYKKRYNVAVSRARDQLWIVHSGSLFFRDPDQAMAPVFSKLTFLEIEPLGSGGTINFAADSPTIERIKRTAESMRASWADEKQNAQ